MSAGNAAYVEDQLLPLVRRAYGSGAGVAREPSAWRRGPSPWMDHGFEGAAPPPNACSS